MILGVDIGGTKTLLGVFSNDGALGEKIRFETPKKYSDFLAAFSAAHSELKPTSYKLAVSAAPGKIDRDTGTGLVFGNLPWKNAPLAKDISSVAGCKTYIENDSKLAALSEAKDWQAKDKKVLYVTISTGISGGVVEDGVLEESLIDGELGQVLVPHNGKLVTWESVASGGAIVRKYGKRASDINDPKVWQEISQVFSTGFVDLCSVIQPEMVIVGGGVGAHFNKFGSFLKKDIKGMLSPLVSMPEIVGAKDAELAALKGCYVYAKGKLAEA